MNKAESTSNEMQQAENAESSARKEFFIEFESGANISFQWTDLMSPAPGNGEIIMPYRENEQAGLQKELNKSSNEVNQ